MSAHAANRQAQERKAHKACLSGDYAKGVSILSDLFVDSDDPTYIFNQGRCFEQNRRYEDAIARFQEYLRAGTNTPLKSSDKALAEKHIADCQDLLTKQPGYIAPAAPSQPVQTPIAPPAPASPPPTTVPAPVMLQQVQQQPAGTPGSGLRTAGIVTASVGGAALIAGVILNLKVNSMASSMETTPGGYTPGKESNRKTYQTLGWVGYGAGAACIATGSVLYLLGLKSGPSDTASVAFVPAFAPGQTGAVLKGGF
jgi:tetratricopeptide (TPR) repeat protein